MELDENERELHQLSPIVYTAQPAPLARRAQGKAKSIRTFFFPSNNVHGLTALKSLRWHEIHRSLVGIIAAVKDFSNGNFPASRSPTYFSHYSNFLVTSGLVPAT